MSKALPFEIKYEILNPNVNRNITNHHFGDLIIKPKEDETLLSWILRQSIRFQVTPGEFIKSEQRYWRIKKCIDFYPKNNMKISDWLRKIDILPQIDEFYFVFEVRGLFNGGKDQQIHLSDWIDPLNENQLSLIYLREIFDFNIRFCPKCWQKKENRYLKKIWRHNSVVVCPEHGTSLIYQCPGCSTILVPNFAEFHESHLLNCQNCDLDLLSYQYNIDMTIFSIQKKILNKFFIDSQLPSKNVLITNNIYGLPLSKEIMQFIQLMIKKVSYRGNYGFENAKAMLMFLARKQKQVPFANRDITAKKINYYIRSGRWETFGIFKWDDLIMHLFGCTSEHPKFYVGPNSLDRATNMIRSYKKVLQRYPKPSDKQMGPIYRSILRGEWRDKNIFKWSDILKISLKVNFKSPM